MCFSKVSTQCAIDLTHRAAIYYIPVSRLTVLIVIIYLTYIHALAGKNGREPGNEALLVIIQGKYHAAHELYSLLVGRHVLGYNHRSIRRLL